MLGAQAWAGCESTNIAAQIVENMHRDAQQQIDQNGLLEYDLGDAMEVNVALKTENIEASDALTRLRSVKALSDVQIQRLRDSDRAKRTRINALEASTSSAPFSLTENIYTYVYIYIYIRTCI